jgi:filamentous hemagglutinin family protein
VGIENILSRVTGGNASQILGRLGVLGDANLFLLNPNGILFGENASLDIEGSFLGTTANSFTFPDGSEFSATNPQAPPLLTISVPLGLQYGSNLGNVQVQGSNLRVNTGKTLALVGGNVSMDGGQLQASGGRIELGGVAGKGSVGLSINGSSIGLSFPMSNGVPLSNVSLDNGTMVKVNAGGDGNIAINAHNLRMAGGSRLQAGASWLVSSNSNPGDIEINATGAINLTEGSVIENLVFNGAMGKGGDINITAESLAVTNGARLGANSFGKGDAGNLNIIVRDQVSFKGMGSNAESVVASTAEGQAGQISITARSLWVSGGATLVAHTFGQGNAGNVRINATDSISLEGANTGIGSQVFSTAVGNGGSINLSTGTLSASGGAILNTSISGQGNGGSINISTGTLSASGGATLAANTYGQGNAGNVMISATDSVSLEGSNTAIGNQVFPGAVGNGGSITISTGTLSLSNDAQLVANTSGRGNAGNVTISATDSVSLDGANTGIGSQVFPGAVGNGGSITISTGTLSLSNDAQLVANTSGQGNAGNVMINATDSVSLDGANTGIGSQVFPGAVGNGGSINIITGTLSASGGAILATNTNGRGNAGDVMISATDSVSLDGVGIDTQVTGIGSQVLADGVGNGGNIEITAGLLALTNGARLITSTAGQGRGGNVDIRVHDTVSFDGVGSNGKSSGVFSSVEAGGVGKGGDISVTSDTLSIADGAVLDARSKDKSSSASPAGDVIINTGQLTARNGTIATSADQSTGGAITITAKRIRLFGDSDITSRVGSGAGNGGNINLTADSIVALDDSDILAFARDGQGGNVTLTTPAFFGQNYRPAPKGTDPDTLDNNNRVDINATGAVEGVVTITSDTSFIENSFILLSANQIDTDSLIASSCIAHRYEPQRGSFFITGTGGIPFRPGDAYVIPYQTGTVRSIPSKGDGEGGGDRGASPSTRTTRRPWKMGDPIIEPTGIYRLPNGELIMSRECEQ